MAISDYFIKPNDDGLYLIEQSVKAYGLWTPFGIISPLITGIAPDGSVMVVYSLRPGGQFKEAQKRKIKYVEERGVKVNVLYDDDKVEDRA